MSALTPIICPFEQHSLTDLVAFLNESLEKVEVVTRSSISVWRKRAEQEILHHDNNNVDSQWLHAIKRWLAHCTGKAFETFSRSELVNAFLEIHLSLRNEEVFFAKRKLAELQKLAELRSFSTHGFQSHQHNLLEDLETALEDMSLNDLGLEELDIQDDDIEDDTTVLPSIRQQEQLNSPPRKRQRIASSAARHSVHPIPLTARSKSSWNMYLKSNPDIWLEKCREWVRDLTLAYENRENLHLSDNDCQTHLDNVVATLREIRAVQAGIYKHKEWQEAVKSSGLAKAICSWSDPKGLVHWKADFVTLLIRKHKILETLLLVLGSWVPSASKDSWVDQDNALTFTSSSVNYVEDLGGHLFRAFKKYPHMIPREACPSSVFFLLNLKNFKEAASQWLGFAFSKEKLNTRFLNSELETQRAYNELMEKLHKFKEAEFNDIKDPALRTIFQRSVAFRNLIDKPKENFFKNRPSLNAPCRLCKDLDDEHKCIQKIAVKIQKTDNRWIGSGVSYSPRDKVDAVPIRNNKDGDFEERPVIHPIKDLGLRRIQCSDEILERCGSLTYYICDEKEPNKILDFWMFNAFPEAVLKTLIDHHEALQTIKGVDRGDQFESYSQGSMVPKGSRAPKGGAPGDSYTMYSGMDAVDEQSINALFDDAEDSMILVQAARVIHPPAYQKMELEIIDGDKLGISGATTYLCRNYTSPLHRDDDACPGLCAQYQLQAKKKGDEYAFIFADYGIYVVSRSNSLWSFDGSMTHGTLLPCNDPLEAADITMDHGGPNSPPVRISNGSHATKNNRNTNAARKYRAARVSQKNIQEYWGV
ncbi:hypothetical protein CVT26_001221 [Gymnopilus dilepis]|uniref:Uncharacterized protein n=1 Tax=Gymnopilus dilepis TaxID=231916 RepID=A0A409WBD4_9AGAR|nr:hypothetical protein CVT26_001221 [Gymnopilus dilepis]